MKRITITGVTDGKTLTISPLDFDDWRELDEWHGAGAVHPCPDNILAIKQKSRLSWRQIEDKCKEFSPGDDTIVKVSRNTIIDNEAKHQLERVVRPNPEP